MIRLWLIWLINFLAGAWLWLICLISFLAGLATFRLSTSRRLWLHFVVPFVAWLAIVFIPGLLAGDRYELLWRVISVAPAVGLGAVSGALSEIPVAILAKRKRTDDGVAPPKV